MQPDQAADFVGGILARNNVPFGTSDDGRAHRVQTGSTAVFIEVSPWGEEDSLVHIMAVLLEELDWDVSAKALEQINKLNCERFFGKFCLYDSVIRVEYDMLASHMQADELMAALSLIATTADENDDKLQKELGGKTWEQVQQAAEQEEEALDT
jgi:T3SS (YopN, CesT) and YbjN peptide-binding chaperone 1